MNSDRPYHQAFTQLQVRQYLWEQSGKFFDPHVVEEFLKLLDEEFPTS